jgi:hypothetical protein
MPRTAAPCKVGTRTEGIVLAALLERGFEVMIPFGNRAKYDFVIDDGRRLQRVQVKTAQGGTNHSALRFNTYSLSAAHRGKRRKCSYRGLIDLFAVYFPRNRRFTWCRRRRLRTAANVTCGSDRPKTGNSKGSAGPRTSRASEASSRIEAGRRWLASASASSTLQE